MDRLSRLERELVLGLAVVLDQPAHMELDSVGLGELTLWFGANIKGGGDVVARLAQIIRRKVSFDRITKSLGLRGSRYDRREDQAEGKCNCERSMRQIA